MPGHDDFLIYLKQQYSLIKEQQISPSIQKTEYQTELHPETLEPLNYKETYLNPSSIVNYFTKQTPKGPKNFYVIACLVPDNVSIKGTEVREPYPDGLRYKIKYCTLPFNAVSSEGKINPYFTDKNPSLMRQTILDRKIENPEELHRKQIPDKYKTPENIGDTLNRKKLSHLSPEELEKKYTLLSKLSRLDGNQFKSFIATISDPITKNKLRKLYNRIQIRNKSMSPANRGINTELEPEIIFNKPSFNLPNEDQLLDNPSIIDTSEFKSNLQKLDRDKFEDYLDTIDTPYLKPKLRDAYNNL